MAGSGQIDHGKFKRVPEREHRCWNLVPSSYGPTLQIQRSGPMLEGEDFSLRRHGGTAWSHKFGRGCGRSTQEFSMHTWRTEIPGARYLSRPKSRPIQFEAAHSEGPACGTTGGGRRHGHY